MSPLHNNYFTTFYHTVMIIRRFSKVLFYLLVLACIVACKVEEPLKPIESIAFNKTEVTMTAGDSINMELVLTPVNSIATKTEWKSSNEKVITVTNGKIKALARGTAQVEVEVDDFFTAKCLITVTKTDIPYTLVWNDEFDGTLLDQTKWSYETGGNGWGNNEKQYYTNRTENLRLENGSLVIEAKKEVYQTNNYTSARIITRDKAAFSYGKLEARISLPAGAGTWPAFWTLGSNIGVARWPLCGEIDIMEHIGSQPTMISHATHTSEKNGSRGNNWYNRQTRADVEGNYHTYAIEWEEKFNEGDDCISFYIDGVKSTTVWEPHVNATIQQWPFKLDQFLILNLALGGNMGGTIDDTIFNNPILMKVDYVRVYQRK